MPEMLIDGTGSGNLVAVTGDNRLKVDAVLSGTQTLSISGGIHIGSVSANVDSIYVQSGIINIQDEIPISANKNNAAGSLIYDGDLVGSIVAIIGATSYVNVLTYSGPNNVLVNIGSWSQL